MTRWEMSCCAFLIAVGATAALTGCSSAEPQAETTTVRYTGPFAAEFERLGQQDNQLLHRIIEDSQISDAELSETAELYKHCLAAAGFTDVEIRQDGQLSLNDSSGDLDSVNAKVYECNKTEIYPSVSMLYFEMNANPANRDRSEFIYTCLQEKSVLQPDVSLEQFRQLVPSNQFDLGLAFKQAPECDQESLPVK